MHSQAEALFNVYPACWAWNVPPTGSESYLYMATAVLKQCMVAAYSLQHDKCSSGLCVVGHLNETCDTSGQHLILHCPQGCFTLVSETHPIPESRSSHMCTMRQKELLPQLSHVNLLSHEILSHLSHHADACQLLKLIKSPALSSHQSAALLT